MSLSSTRYNGYSGEIYSALSIDVEDGLNILMRDMFDVNIPPTERVIRNTEIILDLFNKNNVKATFFILGEIASAYPSLVRAIASYGHEIGVHGYNHDQFFKLTPTKAREDIYKAKTLIENITGARVYGFRAPAFSIFENTRWGLDVISELGFKYDSSIVPSKGDRYGWPEISKEIHRLMLSGGNSLIEVPISVINILGRTIPACGGGYLRHFPYCFTRKAFLTIRKQRPVIVYLHPYELDKDRYPDFFYEAMASLRFRKRLSMSFYRWNKGTVQRKLHRLIEEFHFTSIIDIVNDYEKHSQVPVRYLENKII
jgi:polysaccharide deacetylase family protein (PEP-CTERM system associated)